MFGYDLDSTWKYVGVRATLIGSWKSAVLMKEELLDHAAIFIDGKHWGHFWRCLRKGGKEE
jgi:hypothetical protein